MCMWCDACGLFGFRNLEHSTILYEDPKQLPLLRLSWNKQDPNYLATLALESTEVSEQSLTVMTTVDCMCCWAFVIVYIIEPSLYWLICHPFCVFQVIILDVRVPSIPVARLCNHRASVNGITWAPHSSCHICTAGELQHVHSPETLCWPRACSIILYNAML